MAPFVVKEHQSEPRESFVANPVAERFAAGVIARYLTFQAGSARARRRSMSKPPPGAGARVGQVGAVRAGADGAVEMLVELGVVLADPGDRVADGAGHTGSGAFGCGCGSSIATAQANGAGQLSNEEVAFGVRLCGSLGVAEGAGLLDVVFDLGEASPVRVFGLHVEDLARVAQWRARQADRLAAIDLRNRAGLGGGEGQHMELSAGGGEQPREVPHALEVSHSHRAPLEHHRPVVALATKGVEVCGRLLVPSTVALDVPCWARGLRSFDPLEHRTGRLVLQVALVLAAAGAKGFGEAYACDRLLIGRADLVPNSRSFGKQPLPIRRLALCEPHPSSSECRAGDQRLAVEPCGHQLQFLGS